LFLAGGEHSLDHFDVDERHEDSSDMSAVEVTGQNY
jgi:hypothetical protein